MFTATISHDIYNIGFHRFTTRHFDSTSVIYQRKKESKICPGTAVSLGVYCGHSTQRKKASDSELFVCPWDASVIVKAYQNLGAKNEPREGEKREKKRDKKCTWL